jgi:hypothetical protein
MRHIHHASRLLALLAPLAFLSGCLKDKCDSTFVFLRFDPVYMSAQDIRKDIVAGPARPLENPGKLYFYQDYVLINELYEGVHVFDNRDARNPVALAFIAIPGNVDMAVRGNILYADNVMDLVTVDISNPLAPSFLHREENVFPTHSVPEDPRGVLVRFEASEVREEGPCDQPNQGLWWWRGDVLFARPGAFADAGGARAESAAAAAVATGVGGSLARFTIANDYLYTVDNASLRVFHLGDPARPRAANTVQIGWGIETIFPYKNNLFIGSNSGMFIFDNRNPQAPSLMSTFQHARACDPVFVDDEVAYVTLRGGTICEGFNNQLDVIDVSDLRNPKLIRTYPMHHPIGLSINDKVLYLCEDDQGLKLFDVNDVRRIDKNQIAHFKGFTAYDVITLDHRKLAMVIGKDGLYQFDIANPRDVKQLSVIPVVKRD